jgi:hypothetical protein
MVFMRSKSYKKNYILLSFLHLNFNMHLIFSILVRSIKKLKSCGKTCIDRRSVICSLAQNRITRPGFER